MSTQLLTVSVVAAGVAGMSAYADRRRLRRTDLDNVGFVPWPTVLVIAVMVAVLSAALGFSL